jgi:hypothetical protein
LYEVLIANKIIPNQTGFFTGALSHLKLLQLMSREEKVIKPNFAAQPVL